MGRVYIANTGCVIVTTTTTTVVTTTTTAPITTTTTTQDWSECVQCPPGYEAVPQGCIQYDEVAATYSGTTYTIVKKVSNKLYSSYGAVVFDTWNYNGTGTYQSIPNTNTYWVNYPYPSYVGALNRCSVWANVTTEYQDIGFSFCINVDIPKVYYVGFACDNWGKIKLNGSYILEQDLPAMATMFGITDPSNLTSHVHWTIYPIYFPQGQNVIEVFGHNTVNVAAIGIEIYDATPSEIINATSDADLAGKFLFRSQNLVGQTLFYEYSTGGGFHGYSCAPGYALSTCGETVMCVKRDFIPCQGGTTTTTTAIPLTTTSTTQAATTTTTIGITTSTTTGAITTTTTAAVTTTTTTAAPVGSVDLSCVTSSNAASYLTTPTYDGSGQAVHPDVYYNPYGWNGYKYWMAMTPYPSSNDIYENPSILVSDDGETWEVPDGLTNPIATPSSGHLADTDVFVGYDGLMYVVYIKVIGAAVTTHYKYSSDGISWSSEQTITQTTADTIGSPAIVMENNEYVMYYAYAAVDPNEIRRISCATMSGTWSSATTCTLNNMPSGRRAWHLDVVKYGAEYHMLLVTSTDDSGSGSILYFAKSSNGTTWDIGSNVLINKTVSGWDNSLIYRGTMVLMNNGSFYYDCWYSARSTGGIWHIGRTTISLCTLTTTTSTTAAITTTTTTNIPVTTTTTTSVVNLLNGLVSVWELDEASGTTAEDVHGAYDLTNTGATVNQTGKINKCYSLNGSSNYMRVSNPNFSGTALSINFWINPADITGSAAGFSIRVITQYDGSGGLTNGQWLCDLGLDGVAGNLRFILSTSTGTTTASASSLITISEWQMITFVYDGSNMYLYKNGSSAISPVAKTGTRNNPATPLTIGQDGATMAQNYYNGLFDQTAIWTRALTTTEINYLYNSGNGLAYTSWSSATTTTTTTV